MGFFDRLSAGWELGKQSLWVIWNDKTLLLFPVLSGLASIATIGLFYLGIGPAEVQRLLEEWGRSEATGEVSSEAIVIALLLYFSLAFVTVFFNVALVGCARISMTERDSKLVDGIGVALANLPSIIGWALVSGTVGLLLSALENEKRSSRFIATILGTAWSALTYFVVPIMVVEKVNAFSAIGRSARLLKQTWGEALGARFGLGWLLFLMNLPTVLLVAIAFALGPSMPLIVVIALWVAFTVILAQAAKAVLTVVIYGYAAESNVPMGFNQRAIQDAFEPRDTSESW